jgi:putative FmdB family regulatory protein
MRYEYKCKECEHEFIFERHNSEYELPADCPKCGVKDAGIKQMSTPFFITSGGGHKNTIR